MTGLVVSSSSLRRVASSKVSTASGTTWTYRSAGPDGSASSAPVVLVHGIGLSSWTYRYVVDLLAKDGLRAIAPDWLGHGGTDAPRDLAYAREDYMRGWEEFLAAAGLGDTKVNLVVQGYVLSQYALLWAAQNEERVDKLVILPTPLALRSKLPPTLAAYKNPVPFLRPKAGAKFQADLWAASGLAYVMQGSDADGYQEPYERNEFASEVVRRSMEALDWTALLRDVDEAFRGYRGEGLLVPAGSDPFIPDLREPFEWLETKRTNLKCQPLDAKVGNLAQEDYAEPTAKRIVEFIQGTWQPTKGSTKRGA